MKLLIPHRRIKPSHVKHAAAGMTVSAGWAEVFLPYHIGALLFVLGGCLAIYEPMLFEHIEMENEDAD